MPSMNRPAFAFDVCGVAVLASVCALSVLTLAAAVIAQTAAPFEGPSCAAPPAAPDSDPWPRAETDALGHTTSPLPVTFSGATLLENDRATTALRLVGIAPRSSNGGTITGNDPYVYSPAARFTGTDIFTYEIGDTAGATTIGVVNVLVNPDVTAPTVNITAPNSGTVSGIVTMTAAAADHVRVAGVRFFDGVTEIGEEVHTAPFGASWDSRLVPDGTHTLTAVARDLAGNIATSAAVAVNVVNTLPR